MQTKTKTLHEVIVTSLVKLAIVTAAQVSYFTFILQKDITFSENLGWAVTAFALSLALGYVMRRYFNK